MIKKKQLKQVDKALLSVRKALATQKGKSQRRVLFDLILTKVDEIKQYKPESEVAAELPKPTMGLLNDLHNEKPVEERAEDANG